MYLAYHWPMIGQMSLTEKCLK